MKVDDIYELPDGDIRLSMWLATEGAESFMELIHLVIEQGSGWTFMSGDYHHEVIPWTTLADRVVGWRGATDGIIDSVDELFLYYALVYTLLCEGDWLC